MDTPSLPPHPTIPSHITVTASSAVPAVTSIHQNYPDSIDSSPRSRNVDNYDHDTLPPVPGANLRLMCSFGGHIIPRPHDKSLCYVAGETRLLVVDRHSSLSSLCSRLSRSVVNGRSFTLKYQLPNEDLDSLVSITTDEDLENMIEEYDRLMEASTSTLTTSSRIRLFLFFDKPETAASMGSFLDDAKSKTWFVDALNGSGLIPRGLSDTTMDCLLNLDNENDLEPQTEGEQNNQVKNKVHDQYSLPDSPMVETSSSFGYSSLSPSMSNLPPIRVRVEDQRSGIEKQFAQMTFAHSGFQKQQDEGVAVYSGNAPPPMPVAVTNTPSLIHTGVPGENTSKILSDDERSDHGVSVRLRKPPSPLQPAQHKACAAYNLPSPDSVASDSSIASACPLSKPMYYQDQVGAASGENRAPTSTITISDVPSLNSQIQDSGYILPPQSDQRQQAQQQFVRASIPFIPQPTTTPPVPISSYYPIYASSHPHHPIDQQYPVYVMPVEQTQPSMSLQSHISETNVVVASSRPQMLPTPAIVAASAARNERTPPIYPIKTTAAQAKAEMAANVYRTAIASTPLFKIPTSQFPQQYVNCSQVQHPSQSIAVTPAASDNYGYDYNNPASHEQIYYTQHQGAPFNLLGTKP